MQQNNISWENEDTIAMKAYKEKVRSGETTPMKYTGELKQLLEA